MVGNDKVFAWQISWQKAALSTPNLGHSQGISVFWTQLRTQDPTPAVHSDSIPTPILVPRFSFPQRLSWVHKKTNKKRGSCLAHLGNGIISGAYTACHLTLDLYVSIRKMKHEELLPIFASPLH